MNTLSSGSAVLDALLEGGYETDVVTTLYGPAGTGKTTACLLAVISAAGKKKVIFVDTEGGFSPARLEQLGGKHLLERIFLLQPTTFAAQQKNIQQLKELADDNVGLIVVDTITALYRTERGEDNAGLNRELGKQLGALLTITREKRIPVLVTNQVYANFEDASKVNMVGGDIIKYSSKCIIELQALARNVRRAVLRKHRSLPEKTLLFSIVGSGFEER